MDNKLWSLLAYVGISILFAIGSSFYLARNRWERFGEEQFKDVKTRGIAALMIGIFWPCVLVCLIWMIVELILGIVVSWLGRIGERGSS